MCNLKWCKSVSNSANNPLLKITYSKTSSCDWRGYHFSSCVMIDGSQINVNSTEPDHRLETRRNIFAIGNLDNK